MPTAELIVENVGGFAGEANCYKLSEPLKGHSYVTVLLQMAFGPQDREAAIFPAYPSGAAVRMTRLPGSYVHPEPSSEWALLMAGGYEVVVPDPVVDENPTEIDEPTILESEVAKPVRVHALAKELETTSAELLETLADHGHDITSASANVAPDIADVMRDIYGKGS
ncbi:hypothetical protein CBI33_22595 [Rhodococcus erythropolis]|nr:hypothetical protein CBI33_22595 [Rhodococcus erythropolis]